MLLVVGFSMQNCVILNQDIFEVHYSMASNVHMEDTRILLDDGKSDHAIDKAFANVPLFQIYCMIVWVLNTKV